jgi:hypothetical protein
MIAPFSLDAPLSCILDIDSRPTIIDSTLYFLVSTNAQACDGDVGGWDAELSSISD